MIYKARRSFLKLFWPLNTCFQSAVTSSLGIPLRQMCCLLRVASAADPPFPVKSSSSDEILTVLLPPKYLSILHLRCSAQQCTQTTEALANPHRYFFLVIDYSCQKSQNLAAVCSHFSFLLSLAREGNGVRVSVELHQPHVTPSLAGRVLKKSVTLLKDRNQNRLVSLCFS